MLRPFTLRRYVMLMEQRGFAPSVVLKGTGISYERLSDPSYLVDMEQCQAVITNMIRLTKDPALGLSLGQQITVVDLGIVGHAMMSSRTLRDAIRLWARFSKDMVGVVFRLAAEEHRNGAWTIRMLESASQRAVNTFCFDEVLGMGLVATKALTGLPVRAKELSFAYPAPSHAKDYELLFGCKATFNASSTFITVRAPHLDMQLRHNDEELVQICLHHCGQVMRQIAQNSPLISRVRSLFLQNPGALPSVESMAHQLGMSERTLRRHLSAAGTSFQELLDSYRRDLAVEYLMSHHLMPKEIGHLLGFRYPSGFRRAFKSWTGKTVGEFMDSLERHDHLSTKPLFDKQTFISTI